MPTGLGISMGYWHCAAGKPLQRASAREEGSKKRRRPTRRVIAPISRKKIQQLQALSGAQGGEAYEEAASHCSLDHRAHRGGLCVCPGMVRHPGPGQMAGVTLYIS